MEVSPAIMVGRQYGYDFQGMRGAGTGAVGLLAPEASACQGGASLNRAFPESLPRGRSERFCAGVPYPIQNTPKRL